MAACNASVQAGGSAFELALNSISCSPTVPFTDTCADSRPGDSARAVRAADPAGFGVVASAWLDAAGPTSRHFDTLASMSIGAPSVLPNFQLALAC